jgi:hypothetical protein
MSLDQPFKQDALGQPAKPKPRWPLTPFHTPARQAARR